MNRIERTQLAELQLLLELRQRREATARHERDEKRAARDAAQQVVIQRRREFELIQRQRKELADVVAGEMATQMPRLGPIVIARGEELKYQFGCAEYALIDGEEALAEIQEAVAIAEAAWRQASARCDAIKQLLERTRRTFAQAAEQRVERDAESSGRLPDVFNAGAE